METEMDGCSTIKSDEIIFDKPAPAAEMMTCSDAAAEPKDSKAAESKLVKRTVALHVGYVGTGYKGERAKGSALLHAPV